jgi:hypothetical protein
MTKYNFHTIHVDSVSSNTWTVQGVQNSFTSYLFVPLQDVVQVSILSSSFAVSGSNVIYLNVNELSSTFNDNTGRYEDGSSLPGIVSYPQTKDKIRTALARFNVPAATGRTIYNQNDYSTQTQFSTPVRKLDRLSCEIRDENGNMATTTSNSFITFRFTCIA